MTDRLPWADWMAYGLGRLKLEPRAFWAISLAEWRALLGALEGPAAPLSRAELDDLCSRFPDHASILPGRQI